MAATVVIGFDMDATRKMESFFMAVCAARSLQADGVVIDDLAVVNDHQHGAGKALVFDIGFEGLADGFQALGRESGVFGALGRGKRLGERGRANQEPEHQLG